MSTTKLSVSPHIHGGKSTSGIMLDVLIALLPATVAGALIGKLLKCDMRGVDFAMTALFLVILTDQVREKVNRIPAAIGVFAPVASLFIFGADRMLPPAMLAMISVLLVFRNTKSLAPLKEESKI